MHLSITTLNPAARARWAAAKSNTAEERTWSTLARFCPRLRPTVVTPATSFSRGWRLGWRNWDSWAVADDAVDALDSDEVIVLPNNGNIRPVANRVDELSTKHVWVVPTETIAEGFAALLAYDPEAGGPANATAMESSARRVVPGEVTRAVRDSETDAGPVRAGDWLGLSRDGIEVVGDTLSAASCSLLDLLVSDDHDLVTIIEGEGSGAAETRRITEWLKEARPMVETEVHHGGQPLYPYLFSIE